MISAAPHVKLAMLSTMLLLVGVLVEPANAQSELCKADPVTTVGQAKFRPFSKTKELEGRGSAMADAVAKWEQRVGAALGERWKNWSNARNTSFECAPTKSGKIIGSSFIGCTISGRPCSMEAPTRGGPVVGSRGREGMMVQDGRQDAHRHTGRYSRAYAREMAYQDYLAAKRDRAETRAWKLENARQRYLARQRTRADQYLARSVRRS